MPSNYLIDFSGTIHSSGFILQQLLSIYCTYYNLVGGNVKSGLVNPSIKQPRLPPKKM